MKDRPSGVIFGVQTKKIRRDVECIRWGFALLDRERLKQIFLEQINTPLKSIIGGLSETVFCWKG
jgi:hypothetical protein